MDQMQITETLERLDAVMMIGRPIAMGAAIYAECKDRGLVTVDTVPGDPNPPNPNPVYNGQCPIILLPGLPDWEFQIGPPNA